ncbi:hypothetical protein [Okeania sp. SIO1F9]|uniref:hypothetical protein n=1 Tax=Okeania sp. SIO1F9 TaxID=2607813 RepID=UPI00144B3A4E|nr:hypothetical protein [Okeania sp. SIO1F9]NET77706.1 hypothetical protein [Okeania sp. SIO1F9]
MKWRKFVFSLVNAENLVLNYSFPSFQATSQKCLKKETGDRRQETGGKLHGDSLPQVMREHPR